MRINPVSFNISNQYRNQGFKGISSITADSAKELFGDNADFCGVLSEIKGTDIWTFKRTKGGMSKADAGYLVVIQNKNNGSMYKSFECTEEKTEVEKLLNKFKKTMAWIKAPDNFAIANVIKGANAAKNPEFAKDFVEEMVQAATSREANNWENVVDKI